MNKPSYMTIGTAYFKSEGCAVRFYIPTEGKRAIKYVRRAIAKGKIIIGRPEPGPGEHLSLSPQGQWVITKLDTQE